MNEKDSYTVKESYKEKDSRKDSHKDSNKDSYTVKESYNEKDLKKDSLKDSSENTSLTLSSSFFKYSQESKSDSNQSFSYEDLSISLETSFELLSAKYPQRKTTITISYVKFVKLNKIYIFLITIIRNRGGMYFSAYDSSAYFLVKSYKLLEANHRYVVYGRVMKQNVFILMAENIVKADYRKLAFQLL